MMLVRGQAQHYDWGDEQAIPDMLGVSPDGRPWAEFWWGTHVGAPSTVGDGPVQQLLSTVTGPLPYLVKLLAAARPLSLQLHPNAVQAAAGFAREQAQGLPLDHPNRTYRDPWPKPELLCALTRFEAVCGMAPASVITTRLERLGSAAWDLRRHLDTGGPRAVMSWLLHHRPALDELTSAAREIDEAWAHWLVTLASQYPGDPAVGALPLLNHVVLEPGEALFLGAGHVHAYLRGVGVEVMGASDNVVRGGLTSKYVDADALIALMRTNALPNPVMRPNMERFGDALIARYPTPEAPFLTEHWAIDGTVEIACQGPELWWCASGDITALHQGDCMLVQDGETVSLQGCGEVFRITGAAQRQVPNPAGAPER